MKALPALIIALAILAAAAAYFNVPEKLIQTETPSAQALSDTSSLPASDFAAYYDQNSQFSIKYPVGYLAEESPDFETYLRFTALSPISSAETIDVRLFDVQPLQEDFADLAKQGATLTTINNAPAAVMLQRTTSEVTGETILVRQAVLDCANSTGSHYAAFIVAAIPSTLSSDLKVADYMIKSFNCTAA